MDSSLENRFIAFSVDAAETTCVAPNHPKMQFYYKDDSGAEIVLGDVISPCLDENSRRAEDPVSPQYGLDGAAYNTYYTNSGALLSGDKLNLVLRNTGVLAGNDGAIDNIRIVDVTPQLAKNFASAEVVVGGTSRLVFTIINTSEFGAKNDWSFRDNLASGLSVAENPNLATTCGNVNFDVANQTISLSGNLASGQISCEISLDVIANSVGTYENGADNLTVVGLDEPEIPAKITVVEKRLSTPLAPNTGFAK